MVYLAILFYSIYLHLFHCPSLLHILQRAVEAVHLSTKFLCHMLFCFVLYYIFDFYFGDLAS